MKSFTPTERAFMDRHRVACLATSDSHGAPHAVPIVYAAEDAAVYFIVDDKPKRSHTRLKRLRNIEQNPAVALLVDDYDEDWTRLAYLLIHGQAAIVADRTEYARVLDALRKRYPQYRGMPLAFDSHPMVRIIPERSYFWRAAGEQ
jgi:PPOX class probable F420-dependent enzyme